MNKRRWLSPMVLGVFATCAWVNPAWATAPIADDTLYDFDVAVHMDMLSGKLGDLGGVDYTAQLLPDPGNPHKIFYGVGGRYNGTLTLRRYKMAVDPNECLMDQSKSPLQVSGGSLASANLLDGTNLTIYFNPNDWDENFAALNDFVPSGPISKVALLFLSGGIMNGTANLDSEDVPGQTPLPEDPPNSALAAFGFVSAARPATLPSPNQIRLTDGKPIYKIISGNEDGGVCAGNVSYTQTIRITPRAIKTSLKAKFQDSGAIRGATLTLDGSPSTPFNKIAQFHWDITPDPSCPEGIKPFTGDDQNLSFQTLCAVKAKLTVTDQSGGTDTSERLIPLKKRNWKTKVSFNQTPKRFVNSHLQYPTTYELGRNVCSVEADRGEQESGHTFHTDTNSPLSWEGSGYLIQQVSDSNSPFDGWWYVKKHTMAYTRSIMINGDLFPGSPSQVYEKNQASCRARHASPCDVDLLVAATTFHEITHSALINEAMASDPTLDPATQLESLVGRPEMSRDEFKQKADSIVQLIQGRLFDVTDDTRVVQRMKAQHPEWSIPVTILAPDESGAFMPKTLPNLNENGE